MKQENYDVAVIGAGIGGLCAGALAAKEGYKTLVVERMPFVGGRSSSYEYKGYILTTGAFSVETGGVIERIFNEVGADFDVRDYPPPYYRIEGKDCQLDTGGQLTSLLRHAARDEAEAMRIKAAMVRGFKWAEPSEKISFREWLLQYTDNEHVLGSFRSMIGGLTGMGPEEIPAREYFRFVTHMGGFGKAGFPPKGNLYLMESLANTIKGRGGDVWTRSPAKQIKVDDYKARSVVVEKEGEAIEINAQVVISDIHPKYTIGITGSEHFDKGYLRDVREKLMPVPLLEIVITSDEPLVEHAEGIMFTDTRRLDLVMCPTLICPELAPPGKHFLYTSATLDPISPPWHFKEEIEMNLQDLRDNLPGFKDAELLKVSCFTNDWPCYHSWLGYDLPDQKTPIENLYQIGDATKPSGWLGLPASAETGRLAVEDMKNRISPSG
ncbi:MAG: NAD(P)/FAD-dependent oxidoreductase [Chloroflexota bacterium]|nr:NAD(P)/FAD-dependent oxidoreductase [Chloroflexota bacterium]